MNIIKNLFTSILLFTTLLFAGSFVINNNAEAGDIPYIWRDYGNFSIRGEKDNFNIIKTVKGGCITYTFNLNQIDECDQDSNDWLKLKPDDTDYLYNEVIGENTYEVYKLLQECNIAPCAPNRAYFVLVNNKSYVVKGINISDLQNGNIKFNKSPIKTEIKKSQACISSEEVPSIYLKIGMKRVEVLYLHLLLIAEKLLNPYDLKNIDGDEFEKATETALKKYQKKNSLKQTGKFDNATKKRFIKEIKTKGICRPKN